MQGEQAIFTVIAVSAACKWWILGPATFADKLLVFGDEILSCVHLKFGLSRPVQHTFAETSEIWYNYTR